MRDQLQIGFIVASLMIAFGTALIVVARLRLKNWVTCDAEIISVRAGHSDVDLIEVRYAVAGKETVSMVGAPSVFGYSRRQVGKVQIKYNSRTPAEVSLAVSRGRLNVLGNFILVVGIIWLVFTFARR